MSGKCFDQIWQAIDNQKIKESGMKNNIGSLLKEQIDTIGEKISDCESVLKSLKPHINNYQEFMLKRKELLKERKRLSGALNIYVDLAKRADGVVPEDIYPLLEGVTNGKAEAANSIH